MSETNDWMLGKRFDEALAYAADLHRAQRRKGTDQARDGTPVKPTPYVSHLLAVASLVLEAGGDEDTAIAALLHDAIEDQDRGGATEREIRERFGDDVLRIVQACTKEETDDAASLEEQRLAQRRIRERYYEHVRERAGDRPFLLVTAADKLHNARAIVADLHEHGPAALRRFKDEPSWTLRYYDEVAKALRDAGAPRRLVDALDDAVAEMKALAGNP